MQQLIVQFFERFRSDITESVYAIKGINDYQKLKTFYDYLDYDRQTIYRDKKENQPCGLRNIGNTCYLNVFLQVLYHINFLREKIFANQSKNSSVLQELKFLFGRMQVGKLAYADPTNLFQELMKSHPNVFIEGVQNDFHQICTILLDQLKGCLKESSQNDTKLIDKMLFGKLTIRTYHSEGKSSRNTKFNIINLDSSYESLQNALQNWKNYEIQDYVTENKKTVKAKVQTDFIETPALMTFFINRVAFKNNVLVKDNRQFKFQKDIYLSKSTVGSKNGLNKLTKSFSTKQQQLEEQKQKLLQWIQKVSVQKQLLKGTLKYIEEKEFTNINVPQIQNKFQQSGKIKEYLQEEIRQIQAKIQESKKQINFIQNKISRLFEQNETQLYHLWGMMIHDGTNPTSGHYKIILNIDFNKWTEFNDRKVQIISEEKIKTYSKKGQICCLFYRRPTLDCSEKKVAIPISLKNKVNEIQKQIMEQVDKARILQNLYQLSQSSGYLLQHQIRQKQNNKWLYFFKPINHCFESVYTYQQCQGVLTYQSLKDQTNINKLLSSFLIQKEIQIPNLKLQIPDEYYKYSEIFKTFIKKQISLDLIEQAYEWLGTNLGTPCKNKTVFRWLEKYLEVFIMKGVFYLCVFYRVTITPLLQDKFMRLFRAIETLLKKLNMTSQFTLIYIPIKDQIQKRFIQKSKGSLQNKNESTKILRPTSNAQVSKMMSENPSVLFKQRFDYWIKQRQCLGKIDQEIINREGDLHKQYILQLI